MIDNIIVFAYLIIILAIGIFYRSKSGNFKNYANVKDSTRKNKLILVATMFASSVGGGTTFGIAEKAFLGDLSYTYGLILTVSIDLLVAYYIIPRIITHYGAETIGDIMSKYYGRVGRFISGVASVIVSIGLVATQISVSGHIFRYILKINYIEGVVLSYGIVIIYTTIGGLRSIMFTNLLQFFAMILAIPVITLCGLYKIGFQNFVFELPMEKISLISNYQVLENTISATLGFAVMGLYPNFIQRTLINDNPTETTRAIYIKTILYVLFLIFVTLNGLIAYSLYPTQESNLALPYLIDQIIPVGIQGLVVVGLLSAVMSTADSDLNVTSITLVKDIFNPILKLKNQQTLLIIARITNIIVGSFAIIVALRFKSVVDLVIFVAGFWSPMVIVPLIFALFGITISKRMFVLSSFSGVGFFLLWEYYFIHHLNIKGVFVGTVISLIVFLLGLLWKRFVFRIP